MNECIWCESHKPCAACSYLNEERAKAQAEQRRQLVAAHTEMERRALAAEAFNVTYRTELADVKASLEVESHGWRKAEAEAARLREALDHISACSCVCNDCAQAAEAAKGG